MEPQTRKVRILRSLYGPGQVLHKAGTEAIFPKLFALEMKAANKVEILQEFKDIAAEPEAGQEEPEEKKEAKNARKSR